MTTSDQPHDVRTPSIAELISADRWIDFGNWLLFCRGLSESEVAATYAARRDADPDNFDRAIRLLADWHHWRETNL